jgi:glutathione S-transferase
MQQHSTQKTNNSDTLRFFFHPMSRARSVRWMLEECQATYEAVLLDYGTSMKAPAYLALNPMGKVPALQHGQTVITETAAALAYLADLFPERQLAPAVGSAERGSYYRWLFFVAGPVEAITTAQAEGWLAQQTLQQAQTAGYGRMEDVIGTLQLAVQGKTYVCGTHFSAADIYLSTYLAWACQHGQLPKLPEFERYYQPLMARPAALRAKQIDDSLISAQP